MKSSIPNDYIISFEELRLFFGAKRIHNLKQLLAKNKVSFFVDSDGRPFTTRDALNFALGISHLEVQSDDGFNIDHLHNV